MTREKSKDIYIFLTSHTRSKIIDGNLISGKKLFQVQDRCTVTRLGLLYYIKSILTTVFNNIYTLIDLVNKAKYKAIDISSDKNSISNFQ